MEFILDALSLEYKHHNDWLQLRCMFHGGTDFNLMYRNNFFYCFSQCNKSYNIINVVQNELGLTYGESIKWLKSLLKIEESDYVVISEENRIQLNSLKHMSKKKRVKTEYKPIPKGIIDTVTFGVTHSILTSEGFSREIFEHFNLGLCIDGFFANRLFIPIYDPTGEFIFTASGRALNSEIKPKYKLWGGADKSDILYNYSECKKANKKVVYVVEGFKSIFRLHEWGIDNCVALMGSSISNTQMKLLIALDATVIVISDADQAGINMAQSVENKLHNYCKVIQINLIEEGYSNGDSVAELTKEEFEEIVMKQYGKI